ncbi:hypothetical protein AB0C52_24505 [Streptomyces sp. NPDC048717]|uniref:hypothetical protein n=1 Tax=Streptomyces sp. NPDC048717 TaxID=3154928 RepID=UPI00344062FC
MGKSFQWMDQDQDRVLADLDTLIRDGGGIALVSTGPRVSTVGPAWLDIIESVCTDVIGPGYRQEHGPASHPAEGRDNALLRRELTAFNPNGILENPVPIEAIIATAFPAHLLLGGDGALEVLGRPPPLGDRGSRDISGDRNGVQQLARAAGGGPARRPSPGARARAVPTPATLFVTARKLQTGNEPAFGTKTGQSPPATAPTSPWASPSTAPACAPATPTTSSPLLGRG